MCLDPIIIFSNCFLSRIFVFKSISEIQNRAVLYRRLIKYLKIKDLRRCKFKNSISFMYLYAGSLLTRVVDLYPRSRSRSVYGSEIPLKSIIIFIDIFQFSYFCLFIEYWKIKVRVIWLYMIRHLYWSTADTNLIYFFKKRACFPSLLLIFHLT